MIESWKFFKKKKMKKTLKSWELEKHRNLGVISKGPAQFFKQRKGIAHWEEIKGLKPAGVVFITINYYLQKIIN